MFAKLTALMSTFTRHADKWLHAIVGALIFVAVLFLTGLPDVALGACAVAGVAKEVYDRRQPGHTADWLDAGATIAPGLLGWLLVTSEVLPSWPIG